MSDHPVRFAIVGCGTIAPTHAEALLSLPPDEAVLVACSDIVPDRAKELAERFDIQAMTLETLLADPAIDAVSVCTPSGLHADIGVAALHAGKHVVVEKPMDVTVAACDRLIASQRDSRRILSVISQHRYDPASQRVRQALDSNELGPVILVDGRIPWYRTQEYYDAGDWRGTWAMDGGGCLMNQGVHTVDLMRWLCGPVTTVYAQARTAAHARIEVEDVFSATLTFANGAIGTLMASTAAYPGFAARLAIHGAVGSAIIEGDSLDTLAISGQADAARVPAASHALQVATGGTRAATTSTPPSLPGKGDGGSGATSSAGTGDGGLDPSESHAWGWAHREQLREFACCCRTGDLPLVDGIAGRQAVELVTAAYELARTGQIVTLTGGLT